jgi:hypothetical protein
MRARQAALETLAEPPVPVDPTPLQALVDRLTLATATAHRHRQAIADIDQKLAAIDSDIAAWLWANPNCPTCGAPTTREHLLQEGASHA